MFEKNNIIIYCWKEYSCISWIDNDWLSKKIYFVFPMLAKMQRRELKLLFGQGGGGGGSYILIIMNAITCSTSAHLGFYDHSSIFLRKSNHILTTL